MPTYLLVSVGVRFKMTKLAPLQNQKNRVIKFMERDFIKECEYNAKSRPNTIRGHGQSILTGRKGFILGQKASFPPKKHLLDKLPIRSACPNPFRRMNGFGSGDF
jgi:hypothetical protein